jgi:hypothetical protein
MVISKATRWLTPCLSALAGMSAALLLCNPAAAEACDDQGGCPRGFVCEAHEETGCANIPCTSTDGVCPKTDTCQTTTVSECVPATCTSDADCAADMVCFVESYQECSAGADGRACVGDEECKSIPSEPVCEQKTRSSCVPRYVPPCTVDADCGPGFSCTEIIEQSCSGSGTAPAAGVDAGAAGADGTGDKPSAGQPSPAEASDAGVADAGMIEVSPEPSGDPAKDFAAPEPSCTTRATGTFRCELQRIDCQATTDCPSGFTCEALYAHAVCGSTNLAGAAADAGVSAGEAGTSGGSGGSSGGDDSAPSAPPGVEPRAAADGGEPLPAADGGEAFPEDKPLPADGGSLPPEEERVPPPDTTCQEAPVTEKVCMPPYAREEFARGALGDDAAGSPGLEQSSNTSGSAKDGSAQPPKDATAPALACSVGAPGAGAGGLLGFFSMLGTVAIVIARRGSRRG